MDDGAEDRVPCEDFATCGVAQFQNKQYRKNVKQQDSYFVVEDMAATFGVLLGQGQRVALYGVADGHGEFGEVSANFIRRNFPQQLALSPHFAAGRLGEALFEAFTQTELLQQSANLPLWASGACVCVAAVTAAHIVVANCGDCRCVLSQEGGARDLSNDHNVENATPEEIQRVLAAGGTILPDKRVTLPGAPGRLSTTRSLGDYWAKPQGQPQNAVVSGLPEIRPFDREPGQQLMILCSDGIFGFMSSQDVVQLCLGSAQQLAPSAPISRLAHTLLSTAVNVRQSDDNCTALVLDFTRMAGFERQAQLPNNGGSMGNGAGVGAHSPAGAPPAPTATLHGLHSPQGGYPGQMMVASLQEKHAISSALVGGGGISSPPQLFCGEAMDAGSGFGLSEDLFAPKDDSEASLSSLVAPDEICWCPWCWRQNHDGEPENVVLGSFERWRRHMHDQHFDKLGGTYGPDEVVPCYWCCRPCVTKKGQSHHSNRLPFWGSHERVCRENPNRPALPNQG